MESGEADLSRAEDCVAQAVDLQEPDEHSSGRARRAARSYTAYAVLGWFAIDAVVGVMR